MSLSEDVQWVRWSHSVFCCTCSPPLADSQRMMGNLAMFSEEENDMLVNICSIQWHEYDSHISHSHQSQSGPEPQKQMPWKQTACQPSFSSKGWRFTQHIHISITLQLCQEINHFLLHTKSYLKLRPHFWMRGKINRSIIGTRVRIRMGFTVWQRRDFSLTIYWYSFISHYTTVKSRGSVKFYF